MKDKSQSPEELLKKGYKKLEYKGAYEYLAGKYPDHKLLWWLLVQTKQVLQYALFLYILWFVWNTCHPAVMCPALWELTLQSQNVTGLDIFYNYTFNGSVIT